MKTLVIILLLIPSLGWCEEIALSCERFSSMMDRGKIDDSNIEETPHDKFKHLFIFDNEKMELYRYPTTTLNLQEEKKYVYIFRAQTGDNKNEVAFLNRYTYQIIYQINDNENSLYVESAYTCIKVDERL